MTETQKYLTSLSALPAGAEALTDEPPDAVKAELTAAGVSLGTFIRLVPLLLELFRNEQIRELVTKILAALKPSANP